MGLDFSLYKKIFMKLIESILERLKICWLVLTSHTYYVFFISKPNDKNINGKSKGCYIENPSKFTTEVIIEFLKKEKELHL